MLGLGDRDHLEQILLDSGLRQRGLGELSNDDASHESIGPADFRSWVRGGASQEGLAHELLKHCVGGDVTGDALTDDTIDQVFQQIDTDGGGSLSAEEVSVRLSTQSLRLQPVFHGPMMLQVAEFLETLGLGNKDALFEVLKQQFVAGQSVTDTLVQMSARHVALLKTEMVRFIVVRAVRH